MSRRRAVVLTVAACTAAAIVAAPSAAWAAYNSASSAALSLGSATLAPPTNVSASAKCTGPSSSVTVNGASVAVAGPGAYELISHPVSTAGELALEIGDGVRCYAVCFTPGLAPESRLTSSGEPSAVSSTPNPAR